MFPKRCYDFSSKEEIFGKMHHTKETLAYDAEIYRLFPKNEAHRNEECSSGSSCFQPQFSLFSSPSNLSSSGVDFRNSDTYTPASSVGSIRQHRLSDSISEFNPPFNSSMQEPHSPGFSSCFSPSSEEALPTRYSPPDDLFFSSSTNLRRHSYLSNNSHCDTEKNFMEAIPSQNVCKHVFTQPNRLNISNPVDSFTERVNASQNFSHTQRSNFTDDFFLENPNTRPRALKKSYHCRTVDSHLYPSMLTYTPTFPTGATSNLHFESPGLSIPTAMHFVPASLNIPTGAIGLPSKPVNATSSLQVPFTVALSTPLNLSPNAMPVTQKINLLPKVTTSPTVFQVSPSSVKSSSSSNSDDLIGRDKICSFCRKNGENPRVYTTHVVKKRVNGKQIVTCPILRTYVCSVCNASGDNAHTITYCPLLKTAGISVKPTTITLKSSKMKSDGKPRFPQTRH